MMDPVSLLECIGKFEMHFEVWPFSSLEISLKVITADKCALKSSLKSLLNFTLMLSWQRGSCLGAYFQGTMFDCMTFFDSLWYFPMF